MRKKGRKPKAADAQARKRNAGAQSMQRSEGNAEATGALGAVLGFANAAYSRVPSLPVLERSGTALLIFVMVAYALLVGYVFLFSPALVVNESVAEGMLVKNAELSLLPGESYEYRLPEGINQTSIEYSVGNAPGCSGAYVTENGAGEGLCIMKNGFAAGDLAQSNLGYGNQTILLFAPWMLAVGENFSWKNDASISAAGAVVKSSIFYTASPKVKMAGRDAYPVEVRTGSQAGTAQLKMYIDAEKRVLLLAESGNETIRLVSAPFALDWEK